MLVLSHGRSPPTDGKGAYHFPVTPTLNVHGKTLDELKTRIHEYRLRHNLEIGDIDREINAYYCGKWPGFCHDEKAGIRPSAKEQSREMMNRVSRWASTLVHQMPKGGYELVTQPEADARASVCAECPKRGPWRTGCGGCDAATLSVLQSLKKGRRTAKDGNLAACSIGGWENTSSVWLPDSCLPLTAEQVNSLPPPCWRKAP